MLGGITAWESLDLPLVRSGKAKNES
jgi:hypothetical protein